MGPANTKAFDYMPKGRKDILCTGPAILPMTIMTNDRYWAENEEVVEKRFEKWMTS
jgi:hypothetical protein